MVAKALGVALGLMVAAAPCYADEKARGPAGNAASPQAESPNAPPQSPSTEGQSPYDALADSLTDERQQWTITESECSSSATLDFERFVRRLAIFRDGWLSPDYSLDFYAHHERQVFAVLVSKRLASVMTTLVYRQNPKTDCRFKIFVRYDDKFGQSHAISVLTWTFTKDIAAKLNWDKFDERRFDEIAQDWEYTKEVDEWTADEPPLSDDGRRHPLHHEEETCSDILFNANATFIRATTFCRKDYMDSKAGYTALAGAKECAQSIDGAALKRAAIAAMKRLDEDVRLHGRRAACADVEKLSQKIDAGSR